MAVGKTRKKLNAKASRNTGGGSSLSLKIKGVVLRNSVTDALTVAVLESNYPGVTFTATYEDFLGGLFTVIVTASDSSVINTSTVLCGFGSANDQETPVVGAITYQSAGVFKLRNISLQSSIEDQIAHTINSVFEIANII